MNGQCKAAATIYDMVGPVLFGVVGCVWGSGLYDFVTGVAGCVWGSGLYRGQRVVYGTVGCTGDSGLCAGTVGCTGDSGLCQGLCVVSSGLG